MPKSKKHSWTSQEKALYATLLLLMFGLATSFIFYLTQDEGSTSLDNNKKPIKKLGLFQPKTKPFEFVFCDPELLQFIQNYGPDVEALRLNIEEQLSFIRKVLSSNRTISPTIMEKIFNDPSFSIQITSAEALQGSAAKFISDTNTLYIAWQLQPNEAFILGALQNDLHSASVRYVNQPKLQGKKFFDGKGMHQSLPCLDDKGTIDRELSKQLHDAIHVGDMRIRSFMALRQKSRNALSREERQLLKIYELAMQNYTPFFHEITVALVNAPTRNVYSASYLPSDLHIVKRTATFNAAMITLGGHFSKDNTLSEKIKAFFSDTILGREKRYGRHGVYGRAKLSEEELDSEISSDIEQISPSVREVFYPEWCDYFTQYFSELTTERYCGR